MTLLYRNNITFKSSYITLIPKIPTRFHEFLAKKTTPKGVVLNVKI